MTNHYKHHRKSIRLKGYDYSQEGLYFITICCQGKICRFGHIENEKMILNDAGRMIEKWYYELENKYPDKRCDEMVVMPNHFHCIIENMAYNRNTPKRDTHARETDTHAREMDIHVRETDTHVGASLRGRPEYERPEYERPERGRPEYRRPEREQPEYKQPNPESNEHHYGMDNKIYNASVGDAVGWFKTMTTNKYIDGVKRFNWEQFDKKLWQRNYYEHIIRNEQSYMRIAEYIRNNPQKWINDNFYRKI